MRPVASALVILFSLAAPAAAQLTETEVCGEGATALYFGTANSTQFALCAIMSDLSLDALGNAPNPILERIELRSRGNLQPFATRYAVTALPPFTTLAFNVSRDREDAFLWVTKGTTTYVLHECVNPRTCGDEDDWIAVLNGTTVVLKARCTRGRLDLDQALDEVACGLMDGLTTRLAQIDEIDEMEGRLRYSTTSDQVESQDRNMFRVVRTVPPHILKAATP